MQLRISYVKSISTNKTIRNVLTSTIDSLVYQGQVNGFTILKIKSIPPISCYTFSMKKLLLISTLLFSTLMFSTPSYGEWTKVVENVNGNIFYLDFERIRKVDGYVYWWDLLDRLKPTKRGIWSSKGYYQGDCKLFRLKILNDSYYKTPMGAGTPFKSSNVPETNWRYPSPNSSIEQVLKTVCGQ